MSRNRLIYNCLGVYASQLDCCCKNNAITDQTTTDSIKQLTRIQSFNFDFTRNLENLNELGSLSTNQFIENENPNINLNLSYLLSDGGNEQYIGLDVTQTGFSNNHCLSGIISKNNNEKNYYLLISEEGNDFNNYKGKTGIIGIGNACLTSYSINASVGSLPTVDIQLNGLNIKHYENVTGINNLPSVDPENGTSINNLYFLIPSGNTNDYSGQISALKPGDIKFTMTGAFGFNNVDLKVQDFNLSFDLNRTPLKKVGKKYPFVRDLNFPIKAQLEINVEVGDLESSNLINLICGQSSYDFNIIFNKPGCNIFESSVVYGFKGAKLISQNFNSDIGNNSTMNAVYEIDISDINNENKGLFISGSVNLEKDHYFNDVLLLLHCDKKPLENYSSYTNSFGIKNNLETNLQDIQINDNIYKFGCGSIYFTGNNAEVKGLIDAGPATVFPGPVSGNLYNFRIDLSWYFTTPIEQLPENIYLFGIRSNDYSYNIGFGYYGAPGGGGILNINGFYYVVPSMKENKWNTISFVSEWPDEYISNAISYLYLNGDRYDLSQSFIFNNFDFILQFKTGNGYIPFSGYLDEIRITKNIRSGDIGIYSSPFLNY